MKVLGLMLLLFLPAHSALALCDVTQFHWECDIPFANKPNPSAYSLVHCGNGPVYVNKYQYEQLMRYQRANVNMILTLNGQYITSPCVPAGRDGSQYKQ